MRGRGLGRAACAAWCGVAWGVGRGRLGLIGRFGLLGLGVVGVVGELRGMGELRGEARVVGGEA